jgi:TolA-binding protein
MLSDLLIRSRAFIALGVFALVASPASAAEAGRPEAPPVAAPAVAPAVETTAAPAPASISHPPAIPAQPPAELISKLNAQHRELDDLAAETKAFQAEAKEYRKDAAELISRKLDEKKQELSQFYDKLIKSEEIKERQARVDAIAVFERFISLYPNEPKYTPDAMTRLAELYYEKTVDDAQEALSAYEERVKLGSDEAPPEEQRSFEKSIALYQQIITRFPDYRLADSIYYLLAWCLNEQGEAEESRNEFAELTEKFPKSKYVPEAWVRIGEYNFDFTSPKREIVEQKLRDAIVAYQNALAFKDSPFFDKALYKLGWSYYRLNDYDRAVDSFVRLIDYYDDMKKAGKDTGGDLRQEALQYTAVSFADDNWGATHSLEDFFRQHGARAYEYELFKKLGDIQFDETHYTQAIAAYRAVLQRNPNAPDAPQTQERIVQCYARQQDRETAFKERAILATTYGEKTPWSIANKDNQDALDAARELIEKTLLLTAHYYHEQAEEFAKGSADEALTPDQRDQKRAQALEAYKKAADGYANYLKQFPRSKDVYDIQYLLAETLYNSLQFKKASEAFASVRDSQLDNKYLVNAAYYVVLSLQREIEQEEAQGLLTKRDPCTVAACKDMKEFKPLAIPDVRLRLVQAADMYLQKAPTAEDAALLSYNAAQTFFRYFHFDEAKERYDDVIARFPDKDFAVYAYEDELITAMIQKNWKDAEQIATKMLDMKQVQADPKKYEEKRLIKYGMRFEIANSLMEKKDWDGAAKLYMSVVTDTDAEADQHGKWANADKALFNAAQCYKAEYKFDSAMRTYEKLYTDYPKSDLAEQSLFFVAENAEKAFEFDKAISRYKLLVQQYPKSKDAQAAQYNAARRLEALQRYKDAADEYQKYASLYPNESDAPDQFYQAAVMYQRMHDTWGLITNLQKFILKYQTRTEQHEKVVQAQLKIANAFADLGKAADAKKEYKKTVDAYDRFHMTPDNYNAAQSASEAAFNLAEDDLKGFQELRFDPKGRGKTLVTNMTKDLENLAKRLEQIKSEYGNIIVKYKWPEWMTASLYRYGYADELFVEKIESSPCPKEIKALGEDACDVFNAQLSDKMTPIVERAATAYQTAVDKARELRVVNKWTKLAMEKVCQNTPANCRSMKDPREQFIPDSLSPLPISQDVKGTPEQYAVAAPPPAAQKTVEAPPPAPGAPTAPAIGAPSMTIPIPGAPPAKPVPAIAPAPGPNSPGTTPAAAPPVATTPAKPVVALTPAPGPTASAAVATTPAKPVVTVAPAPTSSAPPTVAPMPAPVSPPAAAPAKPAGSVAPDAGSLAAPAPAAPAAATTPPKTTTAASGGAQ